MRARTCSTLVAVLASIAIVTAGCTGGARIVFRSGGVYSMPQAERIAKEAAAAGIEGKDVAEASSLRGRLLGDLRADGGEAADFATAYTRTFGGAEQRAVPVYAEAATIDGRPVWLVVEVWGPKDGRLDARRLWVLSRPKGEIVSSITVR